VDECGLRSKAIAVPLEGLAGTLFKKFKIIPCGHFGDWFLKSQFVGDPTDSLDQNQSINL
jgi:hypothetical protein